ncbi:efflux RND transporter permease subunit [Pseudomarimonas salicorniae]|uniref:MMPL family transporter n=1 Tax=Pseudomarimonas salicorniae TaxID=2933270 RepID=A0ABT0GJ51_9GAMM|nr:MMPL family transporter [Lysobacter sp. CAU 1642]MCK7594030.1 MMPL family transporter [Lysobacter sp. CAU 1642]
MSVPDSAFHRLAEKLVFGQRRLILVLFVLGTILMAYFAAQLRVEAGFKKQIPLHHEYMQTFLDYEREFGGANRVLVAVIAKDGNMFSVDFMRTMEEMTKDVIALDATDDSRVSSIFTPNVRFVEVVEDGFAGGNVIPQEFTPSLPGFEASEEHFATIRNNIVKANIVGRLVAKDYSGAMIWAELVPEDVNRNLDYQQVAANLEALRQKYEGDKYDIHIIGFAKIVGDIADGAKSVVMFFGIAIVLTFILLLLYSGSFRLASWTVLAAITATIWMLGALRLMGFGIDPMNILTPFLVFAIGVSHGVQMINSWLAERLFGGVEGDAKTLEASTGVYSLEAAKRTFRRLLVPGSIALLSDCIGFITILFINIRIIQELAITASVGVAVIILTNLILLPVLLSMTGFGKRYRAYREKRIRREGRPHPFWNALSSFSKPVPAVIAVLIGIGLAVWGSHEAKNMKIGDSEAGVPELRQDARFNQDARAISERFGLGIDAINVIVEARPDACTLSSQVMQLVDRFSWHMANVEGVQQVISLPMAAKIVNAGWNEGNIRWRVLPRNPDSLRVATQGFETDSGLLNSDCSAMPVMLFLTDHKAETIDRVINAVKEFRAANDAWHPGVNLRVQLSEEAEKVLADGGEFDSDAVNLRLATGNAGVMAATNEEVKAEQFPMMMWVYLAVIVLCLLTYRSIMATVCIVAPLALVSVLANALMANMNIGLKVNTLPVAALGVGIGVDYAIYIYSRMKEFLDQGESLHEAYYKALRLTGTAVLFTAVTLAVGVGTWIFSELKFQADMGILLSFMFVMNMIGALILLPALLRLLTKAGWSKPKAA